MLLAEFLISNPTRLDRDLEKALWKAYITLKGFSGILQRDQDKYLYLGDHSNKAVTLCCLDPADELREMYRHFNNVAAFSGTLTPLDYHGMAMGFVERALVKLDTAGWLDENNCLITVASGVNTRYNTRTAESSAIAKIIRDCVKYQPGGYLAVMPSFEFLEQVYAHFTDINDRYEILVQKPRMSYDDRKHFIRLLKRKNRTTLAFVVAGGQFTEAEDYPGDACVGVIIVSPCLPPPDMIRNATLAYWDRQGEDGHSIAYLYTGIRRVIQAGGRLLRRTDDRGIILLIGDRFLEQPVLGLLPQHWQRSIVKDQSDWRTRVKDFWFNLDKLIT
jgi:DNA excision repair protein ERCC-2